MKRKSLTIFVILLLGNILGMSGIIAGDFETNMERTFGQIFPQIVNTDPYDNEQNVELNRVIIVNFSEPMNTPTVTYSCNPVLSAGFTQSWSPDSKNVTFIHYSDFEKLTTYIFEITAGQDLDGNPLVQGSIPNPWNFTTVADAPFIIETIPMHDDTGVGLDVDIIVEFSQPMDTATLTYSCSPTIAGGFTAQWNVNNDTVIYSHTTDFETETIYEFEITGGYDIDSNPLVQDSIPNPWNFTTRSDNPTIEETSPDDNDLNVPVDADIVVEFSDAMQPGTVALQCTPDPGGWGTPSWHPLNTIVTYSHSTAFAKNTEYTCQITAGKGDNGLDLDLTVKNPWSFTTADDNPVITLTSPKDGATNVLLNAEIVVGFSKAMDITTVQHSSTPSVTGDFTADWNLDNTEVSYQHTVDFAKSTMYLFHITAAKDQAGYDLVAGSIPNPFVFTTIGDNPVIIETNPADGSTGVALDAYIIVEFSNPMNTASVTFESNPTPAGGYTSNWNAEGDTLTFSHTANFIKDQVYTFKITGGMDTYGNDLVEGIIPNPWAFRTTGDEPVIFSTTPAEGDTEVFPGQKIVIEFSEPMNTATVTFTITSPAGDPGGWSDPWSNGDKTLTLDHNNFATETKYKFEITAGQDLTGSALIAGPVPNPFEFTTGPTWLYPDFSATLQSPADGANVASLTPTLTWSASDDATEYYIYLSTDKALVDSLATAVMTLVDDSTSFTTSALEPRTTYYWTVIPSDGTYLGTCDSGTWSFTTLSQELLRLTTTLLSPSDRINVDTQKPTLTWEATEDSVEYYVFLGIDKAQVNYLDYSVMSMVSDTSYTPAYNLAPNTTYYWTVIPSDGDIMGTSESGVWSFNTPTPTPVKRKQEQDELDWEIWFAIIAIIAILIIVLVIIIIIANLMPKRQRKQPPLEEFRMDWDQNQFR